MNNIIYPLTLHPPFNGIFDITDQPAFPAYRMTGRMTIDLLSALSDLYGQSDTSQKVSRDT